MSPHSHSNHTHASHSHGSESSRNKLWGAFAFIALFAGIEIITGWWYNSLALLSDGIHMVSDSVSLGLAAAASSLALRRASPRRTYGYKRIEVLAAFANALTLLLLCGYLVTQVIHRLLNPVSVNGPAVMGVAVIGLVVNLVVLFVLHRGEGEHSLNEKGAWLHVMGDTLGSVAAVVAGLLITWKGWLIADPLLTLAVVLILMNSSIRLLYRSGHILVEGIPEGADVELLRQDLLASPQIATVHDLHLWSMSGRDNYFSAHISTLPGKLSEKEITHQLSEMLTHKHHLNHITLQVGHCTDADCNSHCG